DDPLPPGWVGRPWALHTGYLRSSPETEWILEMDADTAAQPGLVAALLQVAQQEQWDLITLAPQFILKHPGESWIQPALLTTLIYRFGAVGSEAGSPERVMANGQCLWVKKSVLDAVGGHESSRLSFCDDVTLVRTIAAAGYRVGFLDGSQLFQVRMYTSFQETWREWGRSLDLKDASPWGQIWGDCLFLLATQGLPLVLLIALVASQSWRWGSPLVWASLGLNGVLMLLRIAVLAGIQASYGHKAWSFWLSPLADPLAVVRIILSAGSRPRSWRGRDYQQLGTE
ncbi:MAG: glycosyltransferase, partial [Synechococcaceae cyanobacterium RM1_1_27]|nr:glycosyltransferase [Synechococcaceae cyanobacterium RM1_1_27]